MATNVRAVLMASFLLMLAITLNARVIQEQGGQEDNGEMLREILHDIKQGSIVDQMKKQLLALLLNDQEAKAQAASHLQSLFEGDLDISQEEIDDAYGPTSKPVAAEAQANDLYGSDYFEGDLNIPQEEINDAYGKSSEVSDLHVNVFKILKIIIRIGIHIIICMHAVNYTPTTILCW